MVGRARTLICAISWPGLLAVSAAAFVLAACNVDDRSSATASVDSRPDWNTDFSRHSVPLEEFVSGGPPKDGIPAIDEPRFVDVPAADSFLRPSEPVAVLRAGGEVQAYPFQILIWHEIVNSEIAGDPVAVTYCPLCNSTIAFRRTVDGRVLDFGTTGQLRNSDLVMYDRQTESWWQQLTAEAVVGEMTGKMLDLLPVQTLSWGEVRRSHPDAMVLSRRTGFQRDYGASPYGGYDEPDSDPYLLDGEVDGRLPPKARVTTLRTADGGAVVYPQAVITEAPIADQVDGTPIVIFGDPDVVSATDDPVITEGRKVGAAAVFDRRIDDRTLSFEPGERRGTYVDRQTGSTWNVSGRAISGSMEGAVLRQIPSDDQFWFAVAAFLRDVEIRDGSEGGKGR